MISERKLIIEFEHSCTDVGGEPRVKMVGNTLYAYCDLGSVEASLEYVRGDETYTLSFNVVSDDPDEISELLRKLAD